MPFSKTAWNKLYQEGQMQNHRVQQYRIFLACVSCCIASAGTAHAAGLPTTVAQLMGGQTFATVAALRALAPPEGTGQREVVVNDYDRPNGGGGGSFLWSANDDVLDDDGMTINPTGHSGPGRW